MNLNKYTQKSQEALPAAQRLAQGNQQNWRVSVKRGVKSRAVQKTPRKRAGMRKDLLETSLPADVNNLFTNQIRFRNRVPVHFLWTPVK